MVHRETYDGPPTWLLEAPLAKSKTAGRAGNSAKGVEVNPSIYCNETRTGMSKHERSALKSFLSVNGWSASYTNGRPIYPGSGLPDEGSWPILFTFNGLSDKGTWQEYANKLLAIKERLDKLHDIAELVTNLLRQKARAQLASEVVFQLFVGTVVDSVANLVLDQAKREFNQVASSAEYHTFGQFVMETYHREDRVRWERERKEKDEKEGAEKAALRLSHAAIPSEIEVDGDEEYELDTERINAFDDLEDELEEHEQDCVYCFKEERGDGDCWTRGEMVGDAEQAFSSEGVAFVTLPLGEFTVQQILDNLPNTSQQIATSGHKPDDAVLQTKITKTADGLIVEEAWGRKDTVRLRLGESYTVTDYVSNGLAGLEEVEWPLFEVV